VTVYYFLLTCSWFSGDNELRSQVCENLYACKLWTYLCIIYCSDVVCNSTVTNIV